MLAVHTPSPKHDSLLTIDDVRAKRRAIVDGERELVRITEKLEVDRRAFQQMMFFVPEGMRAQIADDVTPAPDLFRASEAAPTETQRMGITLRRTRPAAANGQQSAGFEFTAFILDVVGKSRDGIGHAELKAAVQNTKHAARLKDQAKAYHRTLGKLIARNDLVRHGSKFYDPAVYEVLKKNGELPEVEEGASGREIGAAARLTLEVLQAHPVGLSGPDLKVLVGADPDAPKSVKGHGQYIYNVLATLIGTGKVIKEGPLYRIAEKTRPRGNGVSGANASEPAR